MSQEVVFSYKTRGNSSPKDKPRVYFTCHPDDFERYFEKICEDIFKTHDCTVYYTDDMNADLSDENNLVDLERMNLFVIPVTFRLLTQPNRAMDSDFRFAMGKHIPVLPMMMEPGIDEFYSKPDKFGELQYMDPYSQDLTAISYEEKLKKYLESVLISDELVQRVRKAFDAYIFLSYRKKDRAYANELMKLIHKNPEFRDIAIWFDEFLTPGESFKENIDRILQDSEMFALLVTPNLLEKPDGKPNFVMAKEYPAAKASGKEVLPAEMEQTDRSKLSSSFTEIPECVDARNDKEFRERLLESLKRVAISKNNNDPEHNFLIGLAYLEGIDVEPDKERGIALITSAGESKLPEAMKKLCDMYHDGINVELDYRQELKWCKRLVEYYTKKYNEEHPETLELLNNLASAYDNLGDYQKAMEISKKTYALRCKVLGEEHPDTLTTLSSMAWAYHALGNYQKALELNEKAYILRCRILGEEHPDTLTTLSNIALAYYVLGDYRKALELNKKAYGMQCKILGEEHLSTLATLNNLASVYGTLGDYQMQLGLNEMTYSLLCKVLGEEHPYTLTSLNNLALANAYFGDNQTALELNKKAYGMCCKILGEEHPDTLTILSNLASICADFDDNQTALELNKKAYGMCCKILGEEHPDTLIVLSNLASAYTELGDYQKALKLNKKIYVLRCKALGEEHPDTLNTLHDLAYDYGKLEDFAKASELFTRVHELRRKVLGEEHPDTVVSLISLAYLYEDLGEFQNVGLSMMCYKIRKLLHA